MKSIVLKVALICFCLTHLMWIAPETGYAQIDQRRLPQAIVGVWLFDEERVILLWIPLGTVMMGK